MNTEQKYQVNAAEGKVRQIRRTLEELTSFGWKATETTKPLQAYDRVPRQIGTNQAAIDTLSPLDKDSKGKLSSCSVKKIC